jgi:hypothetical protein
MTDVVGSGRSPGRRGSGRKDGVMTAREEAAVDGAGTEQGTERTIKKARGIYTELGKRRLVAIPVGKAFSVNAQGDMAERGDILLLDLAALNKGWEVVTPDCLRSDFVRVPDSEGGDDD